MGFKIVKIGGLLASFASKEMDLPFSEQLSMILEELVESGNEMKAGMKRIENLLEGQIIGLAEAGNIALENATSPFISVDEQFAEVRKAKDRFEECYGALVKTDTLNICRGEVAFALASCNGILGINDRRDYWLLKSFNDFSTFGSSNPESPQKRQFQTAVNVTNVASLPVLILVGVFVPVVSVPVLLAGVATSVGINMKASSEVKKAEELEKLIVLEQQQAKQSVLDVGEVIKQLKSAD